MRAFCILAGIAAITVAGPALAHHPEHLDFPFPTRGACEAETQALSNDDDWLLESFPGVFSSAGEVRSFLNRAFSCDVHESDGQWYITDHRSEVLNSDWYLRRQ